MRDTGLGRPTVHATALAGTLDILAAAVLATLAGSDPLRMLRSVASGPFPAAPDWGVSGSLLGLVVHFAIMSIMAAVFVHAHARVGWMRARPILAGALYGLVLWIVMSLIVLPLRWPEIQPRLDAATVLTQLFCHIVLVGMAMGWVVKRSRRA